MNVNVTSWCGHLAWCISDAGPITILKIFCLFWGKGNISGEGGWHQLSFVFPYIRGFFLSFCGLVSCPALNIVHWPGTFRPEKQENLFEYWFCVAKRAHTHTSALYREGICPFSHVGKYPCIFKCEIYCRGILNFSCDAFNRTLCALTT